MSAHARLRGDPPTFIDMRGAIVWPLVVSHRAESRQLHAQWVCHCACGAEHILPGTELRSLARKGRWKCWQCGRTP